MHVGPDSHLKAFLRKGTVWLWVVLFVGKVGVVSITPQKEVGNIAVEINIFQFKVPTIFSVLVVVFSSDVDTFQ